jgi:hypothetical protein
VETRRAALIFAGRGNHAVARHFHRDAIRLLALPAVKVDQERKLALKRLLGARF